MADGAATGLEASRLGTASLGSLSMSGLSCRKDGRKEILRRLAREGRRGSGLGKCRTCLTFIVRRRCLAREHLCWLLLNVY
jgi:hypothetical protein